MEGVSPAWSGGEEKPILLSFFRAAVSFFERRFGLFGFGRFSLRWGEEDVLKEVVVEDDEESLEGNNDNVPTT